MCLGASTLVPDILREMLDAMVSLRHREGCSESEGTLPMASVFRGCRMDQEMYVTQLKKKPYGNPRMKTIPSMEMLVMGFGGSFTETDNRGIKYLLVVGDYFTKWAETFS